MADFYMYIGLPGSGKSTAAAAQKGATIISSDAIRGELYGDENIFGKRDEVFGLMLCRTREALLRGETVCYDATNLASRRRRGLLEQLPKGTKKHAIVVWARYSTCLERNAWLHRRKEFAFNTSQTNRELLEEHFKNYAFCDYFLKNIT